METLRRIIHPEVKVLDAKQGLAEYTASDETVDSYREVIRASGWRFSMFKKNAPFVDSHDYSTIKNLLGQVVDFKVVGKTLVETVQWAKDVAENELARVGWKMTEAGFLKAVSVGFWPVKAVSRGDAEYSRQLQDLGMKADAEVSRIFTEQEQIELSAVIIGANPNAVARSYKDGVITDEDLNLISTETARRETARNTTSPADVLLAQRRAQEAFFRRIEHALERAKGNH
jgi:hypothetical protein